MSADTVIKKIQEKAAAEAAAITSVGKSEAKALRASILADAQKKADEITKRGKSQADMILQGSSQQAELENKLDYLNRKHALLDDVKAAAKKELANYSDKQWEELYTKLVSKYAMDGEVIIMSSAADKKKLTSNGLLGRWNKKLTAEHGTEVHFTVSDEPADIDGGIILCGKIFDIDLSYDAVLDEIFRQNEKEIADCLFGTKVRAK